MKNEGKRFEEDWSSSLSSYCFVHRLKDTAQSYNNSKQTRFTWDNPCDFFVFDSNAHLFYAIECKSTKYKSMSIQIDKNDKSSKMIKYHQIESLRTISKYDGAIAGFMLNFRSENNDIQRLYFISIENFDNMMQQLNKVSFNELDLLTVGKAISIKGEKKRTRWKWNLDDFFKSNSNN
jgi:hypothetical protein